MNQLICASPSHSHYWYEVGMLKVQGGQSRSCVLFLSMLYMHAFYYHQLGRGGGRTLPDVLFLFPTFSREHKRDCPTCKVVFSGWQTFFPPDWGMLRRSRCIQIFL